MNHMDWKSETVKSLLNLGVAMLTLGAGWLVGQFIAYRWAIRQKKRELLLVATNQLYAAYGEFFVVWKLWNLLGKSDSSYADRRWQLLQQAAHAEASAESILLKIVTEFSVSGHEAQDLGRFRQAFQSLRRAIRKDEKLDWHSAQHPQYVAFKQLSCRVACLLQSRQDSKAPDWRKAAMNHLLATSHVSQSNWWKTESPDVSNQSPSSSTPAANHSSSDTLE
jgi:hypothetical protein